MKKLILILTILLASLLLPFSSLAKGPPSTAIMVKDANGIEIGRLIGMETMGWPYVLTDKGFRTLFRMAGGMVYAHTTVYFESLDCSGTAYFGPGRFIGAVFLPTSNDVLAYEAQKLFYSPNDAGSVTVNINTMLDESLACQPMVIPDAVGSPAYPNDPDITGIENTAYPARLRIE